MYAFVIRGLPSWDSRSTIISIIISRPEILARRLEYSLGRRVDSMKSEEKKEHTSFNADRRVTIQTLTFFFIMRSKYLMM